MTAGSGRAIVVTGGASGMGRAVAERLAGEGDLPIVVDVDEQGGAAVAAALACPFVRCDLADLPDGVARLRAEVAEHATVLDGIVNAAGISSGSHFPDIDYATWDRVLRVNLSAPVFVAQALSPLLRRPGAAIVNVTSAEASGVYASGTSPTPDYAAAKAGLKLATECLAVELAPDGIRVNAIAPGFTSTPLTAGMHDRLTPIVPGLVPLGRWGEPRDIADAALFLLSERSAYVTGASLPVDGGMTLGITERTFTAASRAEVAVAP